MHRASVPLALERVFVVASNSAPSRAFIYLFEDDLRGLTLLVKRRVGERLSKVVLVNATFACIHGTVYARYVAFA